MHVTRPRERVHGERESFIGGYGWQRSGLGVGSPRAELGYTEIDGTALWVNELSPYDSDLEWDDLTEPERKARSNGRDQV